MNNSFISRLLRNLADSIDAGTCNEEDWRRARAFAELLADRNTELEKEVHDLQSSFGYLHKRMEAIEKES